MKTTMTKMMLLAALVGAATTGANAGVRFDVEWRVPTYVVVTPELPPTPAPVVEVVPVCPGEGYVWAPGYWTFRDHGYVWVRGAWNRRLMGGRDERGGDYGYERGHDFERDREGYRDRDHGWDDDRGHDRDRDRNYDRNEGWGGRR